MQKVERELGRLRLVRGYKNLKNIETRVVTKSVYYEDLQCELCDDRVEYEAFKDVLYITRQTITLNDGTDDDQNQVYMFDVRHNAP